ncbi:hypothetical protein [Moritella dasanensis]|uniref:hypothetical protein n=1 Tax=Moritella dasanensis TaxID=428031 RepID=UPI00036B6322|nr:hypothetical protein [Moritella dasanensis]
MAKNIYSVTVIRKGRESDYYDFWENDLKVNSQGEELHSDLVGFTENVEAKNLKSAISMVKENHPDNHIVSEHSSKAG